MKKTIQFLLATGCCAAFAGTAVANGAQTSAQQTSNESYYAGMHLGLGIPGGKDSGPVKTGFDIGGQVGYRVNPFRIEGAITYFRNKVKGAANSHTNAMTYMVNGYYDITPFTFNKITPFVGAGIGALHSWASAGGTTLSDTNFAYQIIAGAMYPITPALSVYANYHFLKITGNNGTGHLNILNVGFNYAFG